MSMRKDGGNVFVFFLSFALPNETLSAACSVTKFGEISRLLVFGYFVRVNLVFVKLFRSHVGKMLCYWVHFYSCQWPKLTNLT